MGQNSVFSFSREGKFLNRIGAKGRGPNEYLGANAVFLDDSMVNIYDFYKQTINRYNYRGDFVDNIAVGKSLSSLIPDSEGYVGYNTYSGNEISPAFTWFDKDFTVLKEGGLNRINGSSMPNVFSKYGNNIDFWAILNDTIFDVSKEIVTPKYVVDFEKYTFPSDITTITEKFEYYAKNASHVASMINNVIETDEIVAFTFQHNFILFWALYDKKGNITNLFKLSEVKNPYGNITNIFSINKGCFIGVIQPNEIETFDNPRIIIFKK